MSERHTPSSAGGEMSIGEFSALVRISIRMLRHYDQHGLLVPSSVDAFTGYRRYSSEQLEDAIAIRQLRDVGMTVAQISAVLATRGTPEYSHTLRLQREALAEESTVARQRLSLIDTLIQTDEEQLMSTITVELRTLPATSIVALRGTIPGYAAEGELWQRFMPALTTQGIAITGPGGAIEHDESFTEGEVDESVWFPVSPGSAVTEPLQVLDLPERTVAVAQVTGEYGAVIPAAHDAIGRFTTAHGLHSSWRADDVSTHAFNVYLTDPSQVRPGQAVTEVCVPVTPVAG